jgi:hypothetical protein
MQNLVNPKCESFEVREVEEESWPAHRRLEAKSSSLKLFIIIIIITRIASVYEIKG